ncbi:hypothetical protein, partial [Enterobacter intestinihominis]
SNADAQLACAWSAPGAYCGSGGGLRPTLTPLAVAPVKKHPSPKACFLPNHPIILIKYPNPTHKLNF